MCVCFVSVFFEATELINAFHINIYINNTKMCNSYPFFVLYCREINSLIQSNLSLGNLVASAPLCVVMRYTGDNKSRELSLRSLSYYTAPWSSLWASLHKSASNITISDWLLDGETGLQQNSIYFFFTIASIKLWSCRHFVTCMFCLKHGQVIINKINVLNVV